MKFLDRIALIVFSVMMLMISVLVCLVIFGLLDITTIYMISAKALADSVTCKALIGINIVFILLAIKAIFFESGYSRGEKYNDSILLENDDGKLLITRETLISMVNIVVSGFSSIKKCQPKINLDEKDTLTIIVTIEVDGDTVIKDLINNLQIRIKEKMKESLDLDVNEVTVRVGKIIDTKVEGTNE